MIGGVDTSVGRVPVVSTLLSAADRRGGWLVRWAVGRMSYTVEPGLYAVGAPQGDAPVLVTANYKLSFDHLRRELGGRDLWILVLDTLGINVWCAAGKGTFGTDNLASSLAKSGLERVVGHRRLILPQLGAPGVSAHKVRRRTGWEVVYGPVMAADLPAFLDAGLKAEPRMRLKQFPWRERLGLAPVELVQALRIALPTALALFLLGGLGAGEYWRGAWVNGGFAALAFLAAVVASCVVGPLALPWLPGRAFAVKGLWMGLALSGLVLLKRMPTLPAGWPGMLEALAWPPLLCALASFLVMNFTGASPITSLSGVEKEMRRAVPLQIVGAVLGLGLWLAARLAG